ncbi:MAG: hypothetical protein LUQ50_07475 [Methanospirillum sp.]|nr:hypothetical protein [Methanospirillum sp.]
MRPYIVIGNQSADGRLSCRCSLNGEVFQVRVLPRDMPRIHDRNFQFRYPKACPFLVKGEGDTFNCLIYQNRPGHCRSFFCSHARPDEE